MMVVATRAVFAVHVSAGTHAVGGCVDRTWPARGLGPRGLVRVTWTRSTRAQRTTVVRARLAGVLDLTRVGWREIEVVRVSINLFQMRRRFPKQESDVQKEGY